MRRGLAGTELSPSAVHAIVEIGCYNAQHASTLGALLGLEKSTISRLLANLEAKGLVIGQKAASDPRQKDLSLTLEGRKLFHDIECHARKQVQSALSGVPENRQQLISDGLAGYAIALQNSSSTSETKDHLTDPDVCLGDGYTTTLLARVTEMHAVYYSINFEFGSIFERKVAAEMAEFLGRLNNPANLTLHAKLNGRIVGAVSIDGEDLGDGIAHLRWFIIDDAARGRGIGRTLIKHAMAHVDSYRYVQTQLWTFRGLDAARHLYEKFGFILDGEQRGKQWGTEVTEQKFVRRLPVS